MKYKVTIGVKNTGHYTHSLYIQQNFLFFISDDNNHDTILFIKYKQSLFITLKKTFQLWMRFSISLMVVLNNIRIAKTPTCFIISKISIWMLNRCSLQLVMPSHHVMVLGDLLNIMLQNVDYKDPYMTKF